MELFSIVVSVASLGLIAYVLCGYPLLLDILARRAGRDVAKDSELRAVSIIIAARNAEKFIATKLNSILGLNYPRDLMQIIVISDGSTDRTDEIVASYASEGVDFRRLESSGKAMALNAGISRATAEILILTDARQTLDPDAVRNIVACFGDPTVGAASGELCIRPGVTPEEADTQLYWKYEVFMRKRMSRIDSTFGTNGPFYAMRRSLAVHIPADTLLDDVYLPMAAFFQGYRVVLEDSAKAFDYPTDLSSEFQRKIRTQAGLYQILHQYPQLLGAGNRMRLHFLSAKFGRLAIPFLMILIAIATFGLPDALQQMSFAAQIGFYAIAFLDLWIPDDSALKRLTSPVRTFVVLITAALLACKIMFVSPRKLWKETRVRLT